MHIGLCAGYLLIVNFRRNPPTGLAGRLDIGGALTGLLSHNQQVHHTLHVVSRDKLHKFRASRRMPDARLFKSATWGQYRAFRACKPIPCCAKIAHTTRGGVPDKCFTGRLQPFTGQRWVSATVIYKGATRHAMRPCGADFSLSCVPAYPCCTNPGISNQQLIVCTELLAQTLLTCGQHLANR